MNKLPEHVAIIMDGNGRWARTRGLTRINGHSKGTDAVRNIITRCRELGIPYLTLYAFSEENWKRPKYEVSMLMRLMKKFLLSDRQKLIERGIQVRTIGEIQKLPKDALKVLTDSIDQTAHCTNMVLTLALSYGGRSEIVRAFQKIAQRISQGELAPQDITDKLVSENLDSDMPDPDLIIRTSGEFRTSNFLPWQAIYAEWYITPVLWPDFTVDEFMKALHEFSLRERRFGMTSHQIKAMK